MIKNNKKESLIAIKKARSLLDKVEKMIAEDIYCIKIIQQILAANGLLKSASSKILESHLNTCFKGAMASKDEATKKRMINEILQIHKLNQK